MQYLSILNSTKLSDLIEAVGPRQVDAVLNLNNLTRTPNIGAQLVKVQGQAIIDATSEVGWQRKSTILNKLSGNSDLFEMAATSGSESWKLLSSKDTFPNMLKIPESVQLPQSTEVFGNGQPVPNKVYSEVMNQLSSEATNHKIDMSVFNEYSTIKPSNFAMPTSGSSGNIFQWFHIPWGDITLYSSLSGDSEDFPVYPEEIPDAWHANYTTMPDIIYQYEPWQLYQSSGPRSNQYSFHFHRDMWTGDHRDGGANKLIRFCQANCYPKYNGSAVDIAIVTLYIKGSPLISGVMTDVSVTWTGPIGLDGWYLECTLEITITEISKQALNFDTVKDLSLIG